LDGQQQVETGFLFKSLVEPSWNRDVEQVVTCQATGMLEARKCCVLVMEYFWPAYKPAKSKTGIRTEQAMRLHLDVPVFSVSARPQELPDCRGSVAGCSVLHPLRDRRQVPHKPVLHHNPGNEVPSSGAWGTLDRTSILRGRNALAEKYQMRKCTGKQSRWQSASVAT